ncbi:heptaprenyl diphosphate synthase component 1 [Saccharibacillus kuerlensis]|uniref:Heptaprenyl diphosphate synthase n=1 Tax=Saccharibacillus kuerlensis TaxID=459527 RepID=A0ABQ2L5S7_9BACL|nr:heptaprenyl diphosphate synthase component 1 [Saccharibacillus kuerlensis]GGO04423.1 hypothetical protein GCM10010969_29640 [Saccharibacillus kuerlensis]
MKPYCVPEKTKKYTGYDMIRKHTAIPALPDARLRLLHAFLEASDYAAQSEVYGIVTGLLQTGLDIHDRVAPGDDSEEEQAMRTRQLKVLAGDYYSSLFYQLLAGAGEIAMVAELSRAIADMNRSKMELYLRMQSDSKLELREYLDEKARINVRLFAGFDCLLEEPLLSQWQELLMLVGLCEAASDELAAAVDGEAYEGLAFRNGRLREAAEREQLCAELAALLHDFAKRFEDRIGSLSDRIDRASLLPLSARFLAAAKTKGEVMES